MQATFETAYTAWQQAHAVAYPSTDLTVEQEDHLADIEDKAFMEMLRTPAQTATERADKLAIYLDRDVSAWGGPEIAQIKAQIISEAADGSIR
ncbi:MAG: hypothetical protein WBO17_03130 [Sphingorhabdus sp.]